MRGRKFQRESLMRTAAHIDLAPTASPSSRSKPPTPTRLHAAIALRWTARLSSIASIGLIAAFATADAKLPTPQEWMLLILFPGGVVLGMLIGWWKELLGGLLGTASLLTFYAVFLTSGNPLNKGVWFAVFALPAMLFVASGMLATKRASH